MMVGYSFIFSAEFCSDVSVSKITKIILYGFHLRNLVEEKPTHTRIVSLPLQ